MKDNDGISKTGSSCFGVKGSEGRSTNHRMSKKKNKAQLGRWEEQDEAQTLGAIHFEYSSEGRMLALGHMPYTMVQCLALGHAYARL